MLAFKLNGYGLRKGLSKGMELQISNQCHILVKQIFYYTRALGGC